MIVKVPLLALLVTFALCIDASAACSSTTFNGALAINAAQYTRSIAVADLNGDGLDDLLILNDSANKFSVMLGDGAGGFTTGGDFPMGGHPSSLATGDLNNDGKVDVVAGNSFSGDLGLRLGDGLGGFGPSTTVSIAGRTPSAILTGYFNGDGNQDLAVATDDGSLLILPGNGVGAFGAAVITQSMSMQRPVSMAAADLNLDGNLDVALVTQFGDGPLVLLGNGTGGFSGPIDYPAGGTETTAVTIGDLNNDGRMDIAVSFYANKASVLLNNGDGTFVASPPFTVTGRTPAGTVVLADFNNDGKNDIAVGNVLGASVRFGDGTGAFGAEIGYEAGLGQVFLAVGDFNSDGSSDLIVGAYSSASVVLLLNDGTGAFKDTPRYNVGTNPHGIVTGDFNSDGKLDVAVANQLSNDISILLGNGSGGFGPATNFSVGPPPTFNITNAPTSIATADFNKDGKLDLVTANSLGGNISILLGDGAGSFPTAQKIGFSSGSPTFVAIGDFNADDKVDLAVTRSGTQNLVSILIGTGLGGFAAPVDYTSGGLGPVAITVADLNGDTKPDLAVANQVSTNISIFLNNGTGAFGAATNFPLDYPANISAIVAADVNSDGKADLLTTNQYSNNISLLIGNGAGSFAAHVEFGVGNGPTGIAVADFNGDGMRDIAVANNNSETVTVRFGNGAGNFSAPRSFDSGFGYQVVAADFNGDGSPDIVTDRVSVLLNSCPAAAPVLPKLTVNDVSVSEESGTASFTVTLSASSAQAVSVQYFTSGFTAASTADFLPASGVLNFAPGETSKPVVISLVNDSLNEFAESFALNLHHATNAEIKKRQGMAKITDSDPLPTVSIGNKSANEGDTGTTSFSFAVTLSAPSGKLVSVSGSTADGTASSSSDYQAIANQPVSIPVGTTSGTFLVTVNGDYTIEPDETFSINLSNPGNATIGTAQGLGTIVNDDAPGSLHFNSASQSSSEGSGSAPVVVTRTGGVAGTVTVDYATADGTANQRTDYAVAFGTLTFASGETTKTVDILITDNLYVDGDRSLNMVLSNPTGGATLTTPSSTTITIQDNDSVTPTTNPLDNADAAFFVRQHYYDFLSRVPDPNGFFFWRGQILQCGTDQACLRTKRIDVSNAFFYELEFQQTGSYVYRLYRAAFGNNQPFPNPIPDPLNPNEEKKVVAYQAFVQDRARVVGGANLAQSQLGVATSFAQRPEFLNRYAATLDGPGYVDALLATLNNDLGVNLTAQRLALIDLFNQAGGGNAGRGAVLYRLADDNAQSNPVNNRAFIDAEYNRAFVATQYFGYLRRDPDMAGFLFWLGQVSGAPLRNVAKQHAMVCSFTTSAEYQQRFSSVVSHSNAECQ